MPHWRCFLGSCCDRCTEMPTAFHHEHPLFLCFPQVRLRTKTVFPGSGIVPCGAVRSTFSKPFHEKDDKLNPNTLLGVLWDICRYRGFRTYQEAADVLASEAELSWSRRRMGLTGGVLREIFSQDTPIKYWQLEACARQAGVPTGLLLMFSRLRSNSRKGRIKENEKILSLLGEIALTKPDDTFQIETLYEWAEQLGTSPPPPQLPLDLRSRQSSR